MVSMETEEEVKAIDDALQLVDSRTIYIGLRSTSSPSMPSYMHNM
jgi:hypothetical protein